MKVTKNTTRETLLTYLGRILPAHGYKIVRRSSDWGPTDYFVCPKGFYLSPKKVAEVEQDANFILLKDNDFLQTLTDVLPAWEQLTGETIEVRLAKEIVRA